jgi:flavin reductase ActVB
MSQLMPNHDEQLRDDLRHAMGNLATGVVMVTTMLDGRPWGLTVSACCSVSIDPPMLLVSLGEATASARVIQETKTFGVSILSARCLETAKFGSTRGAPKFIEPFCEGDWEGVSASPAVAGAIAHLDCRVAEIVRGGDHLIFVANVVRVLRSESSDHPLVYHDRRYHRLTEDSDVGAAPPYLMWW